MNTIPKRICLLGLAPLIGLALPAFSAAEPETSSSSAALFPAPGARASHDAAMARYEQGRLGMFIHWGPWSPGDMWGMYRQNIPLKQYEQRVRQYRAERFDAKAIVALARAAGMKYITFVAKHHDGFCLWDTAYSPFNSMKYPMRRDLVGELSRACEEAGMPLILYYSLGLDWTHPDFMTRKQYTFARPNTPDANDSAKKWKPAHFERYRKFCKDQLAELNRKYHIAGFWFDPLGGILANPELFDTEDIYRHIRRLNPSLLIFNKTGVTGTEDIVVGERELASIAMHYGTGDENSRRIRALADAAWKKNRFKKAEIAVTSQGTWAWVSENSKCLPADRLYAMLEKAAGNNANLLLNFGPKKDGSIPEDVDREFRALGQRIRKDGYPPLNTASWKEKRLGKGEVLDDREGQKTAR